MIANKVADSGLLEKRIGGSGPIVSDLEWDVKTYFTLNGAMHDAAVAAWGAKREYDYSRPITMIRHQGSLGQSSDPLGPSYHPDGLALEDGLVEVITAESIAPGGRHRNVLLNANKNAAFFPFVSEGDLIGKIAIMSWNHEPDDPTTQLSGVDWVLAENWVPFQKDNFVTPAFAAYVSGHSTFSRAGAEVLTLLTGDEYFPGGLGEQTFLANDFLEFELGPEGTVTLQWATYYDAADEAGISRLWGGIHVAPDDFNGRIMGSAVGIDAFEFAAQKFGLVPVPEPSTVVLAALGGLALLTVAWRKRAWR
ncbi:MAG: PEP-CTERM sorting domain-containing protein [Planctomycetota bacterium]|nr:MAG: PEP-CTERM sorting domain-containing protein [Planctomycetota bacterium]